MNTRSSWGRALSARLEALSNPTDNGTHTHESKTQQVHQDEAHEGVERRYSAFYVHPENRRIEQDALLQCGFSRLSNSSMVATNRSVRKHFTR